MKSILIVITSLALLPMWSNAQISDKTKISLSCVGSSQGQYLFLKGTMQTLYGKDSANPADCSLLNGMQTVNRLNYFCESYQGAPYIKFSLPTKIFNLQRGQSFLMPIRYLDENITLPNGNFGTMFTVNMNCMVTNK
ncbi:MAG: hypothetical protein AABY64_13610 [Bdellovibrionota bacterium]